jgi:hypothetical protein
MIFLIILVCLGMAAFASSALGDPNQPASAAVFRLPVLEAPRGYSGLEETAVAARMVADADSTWRAANTAEAFRVAGEYAQATEFAYRLRIDGQTATAGSIMSTDNAIERRKASAIASTQTQAVFSAEMAVTNEAATAIAEKNDAEQEKRALDIQSRKTMVTVWAVTKWAIPTFLLGLLGLLAYRWVWKKTEYKEVHANAQGKYPVQIKNGLAINPNLQVNPVMNTAAPEQTPPAVQLLVKQNEQKIDLLRATPSSFPPPALDAPRTAGEIEIIDPGDPAMGNILDEVERKLLMQGGGK